MKDSEEGINFLKFLFHTYHCMLDLKYFVFGLVLFCLALSILELKVFYVWSSYFFQAVAVRITAFDFRIAFRVIYSII